MGEAQEDHDFRKYLAGGNFRECIRCGADFVPNDEDDKYCPDCKEDDR